MSSVAALHAWARAKRLLPAAQLLLATCLLGSVATARAQSTANLIEVAANCKAYVAKTVMRASWSGSCADGYAEGNGVLNLSTGEVQEGIMHAGRFDGVFKDSWPTGNRFEGEVHQGQISGAGKYYWPNGNVYAGSFKNGRREGLGTLYFGCSGHYSGDFHEGAMDGVGSLYLANGNRYEGSVQKGEMQGLGFLVFADGTRYEGEFFGNHQDGVGRLIQTNGDRYEGEFKNDRPEGKVVFTAASGERYEGIYLAGHAAGRGIETLAKGKRVAGEFTQGDDGKLVLAKRLPDPAGAGNGKSLEECKNLCGSTSKSCGSTVTISDAKGGNAPTINGPGGGGNCSESSTSCYESCERQFSSGSPAASGAAGTGAQSGTTTDFWAEQAADTAALQARLAQQQPLLAQMRKKIDDNRAAMAVPDAAAPVVNCPAGAPRS